MAGGSVMSHSFTHSFPHHSTQILDQLNVQRYYAAFCDVTVRVDDVDFKLHKCVLAAASAKMQGMLFNIRPECGSILSLKDVSLNGFKCVVEYIYTGAVKLDTVYVHEILAASQFFEIREIEKFCLDFFKTPLAPPLMAPSNGVPVPPRTDSQLPSLRAALQGIPGGGVTNGPAIHHHPSILPNTHAPAIQPHFAQASFAQPLPHPLAIPPTHMVPVHQIQQPANIASAPGASGASFDGNYIEDYLKLIENLQSDPNQTISAVAAQTQQNSTASIIPPNQNQYSKPVTVLRPPKVLTNSYLDLSAGMPSATKAAVPITQYSVEDLQRTVMNALAQERFDDDEDPDSSATRSTESVPLTALLSIGSEKKTIIGETLQELDGPIPEAIPSEVPDLKHEESCDSNNDNLVVNEEDSSSAAEDGDDTEDKLSINEWGGKQEDSEDESPTSKSGWGKSEPKGRQKRKKKTPVKLLKQKADVSESEEDLNHAAEGGTKHHKTNTACTRPLKKRKLRAKSSKKKTKCEKCGREFGKRELLDRHMAMHSTTAMFSCHICGHKYARPGELTRHMRTHAVDEYECDKCSLHIRSPVLFKRHMELMHGEMRAFQCTAVGCEFRSDKPSNVEKHAAIHAEVKAYACPECSRSFAQPNGLRSHLRSCQQQRRYLCDICGAKFNHLQSMKSHRMLHTGEKPYVCRDCNARFTDHRNFKRHRRIHDNLYPYPCTLCDKRFRHSNSLKAHFGTHAGVGVLKAELPLMTPTASVLDMVTHNMVAQAAPSMGLMPHPIALVHQQTQLVPQQLQFHNL